MQKKRFMSKSKLTLIILLILGSVQAQTIPSVRLQADTLSIRMGEQIALSIQAQADTLSFIDFPEIQDLGDFEVVKTSKIDTLQAKPYKQLLKKYFVTAWDTGKYTIPPISVKIQDSIYKTDSLQVQVMPVAIDTTQQDIYDFKPVLNPAGKSAKTDAGQSSKLWWLLLIPLLALAWYLYTRRKKQIEARKKELTVYEKTIAELQKLENQKLWLAYQVDIHYLKLTDILKDYLEKELHLPVKEKLSFQILNELQKYRFKTGESFSQDLLDKLKQSFQRADLAKFAKLVPHPEEIEFDFSNIKDLINYAHQIVAKIEAEKAAEKARLEAVKRKRRKTAAIVGGSVLLVLALLGGTVYYYLNKAGYLENLQENISKPEWVYNEYGANPAVGLTTPHILKPIDYLSKLDEKQQKDLSNIFDEVSGYADENPIKGYFILEINFDLKPNISKQINIPEEMFVQMFLTGIKAKNTKINSDQLENGKRFYGSFDLTIPKLNITRTFEFDARIYKFNNAYRVVFTAYHQGNEENKNLTERVVNSIQIIQEN